MSDPSGAWTAAILHLPPGKSRPKQTPPRPHVGTSIRQAPAALFWLVLLRPLLAKLIIQSEYHCIEFDSIVSLSICSKVITDRANRYRSGRAIHAHVLPAASDDVVGAKHICCDPVRLWRLRDINPQFFADFSFSVVPWARPLGCPTVGGKGFSTVSATCSFWRRAMALAACRTRK